MTKEFANSLLWGGGVLVIALIASLCRSAGLIDQETTTRIVLGAVGLMVVAFGNRIPKEFSSSEGARKAKRVAGWSMVISGLIYAGAFIFAPMQLGIWIGCGAVVVGIAVTFLYCASQRGRLTP